MKPKQRSAYLEALQYDNSFPIEKEAVELWLADLDNPFRWSVRPLLQLLFAALLHITWFLKRLPLPQFSAHKLLQALICWFCKYFVSYEANMLILRHYSTESNLLNFLALNSGKTPPALLRLYPKTIKDMREDSFVKHDQELFRVFKELGYWDNNLHTLEESQIDWSGWRTVDMDEFNVKKRWSQVMDFESAHALFMCLFCFLLTKEEYRDAINGFNLDQSIAIRLGKILNNPQYAEMAYNKYPLYLVGPWNLAQRFLMHGFFTEYLYAELESRRQDKNRIQG
ncbi:DUF6999 family protein [Halioxenophilus aromaticivorans]|uniref:Uncharacterized protein n=1 Tax=Halioxenophilus aromaticivorans TaxID=1306992 RepID=A0AAV3UAJ0_9ALTE